MSKYDEADKEKEVPKFEVTGKDIEKLRSALKEYEQKRLDDRLTSRFDQYLLDLKVISIREGLPVCHDPEGYHRLSKINARLELLEYYSDQEYFARFPEAKEALRGRIAKMRAGLSEKLRV